MFSLTRVLTQEQAKTSICLTATTHKAAAVLAKSHHKDVNTIHSVLGLKVTKDFRTGLTSLKPSGNKQAMPNLFMVVVDEASMINWELLAYIRKGFSSDTKILYIGDSYQLAPVREPTSPVFTQVKRHAHLTEPVRQQEDSPIFKFGQMFRQLLIDGMHNKRWPSIEDLKANQGEVIHVSHDDWWSMALPAIQQDPMNNKILAWSNNRVQECNSFVRKYLNKPVDLQANEWVVANKPIFTRNNAILARTDQEVLIESIGNRVNWTTLGGHVLPYPGFELWLRQIQIKGFAVYIVESDQVSNYKLLQKYYKGTKDWPNFYLLEEQVADLRPSYASTVYKAQGSTWDQVFIDLDDISRCTSWKEVARMMYVAVTRPRTRVVLAGNIKVMNWTDLNAA